VKEGGKRAKALNRGNYISVNYPARFYVLIMDSTAGTFGHPRHQLHALHVFHAVVVGLVVVQLTSNQYRILHGHGQAPGDVSIVQQSSISHATTASLAGWPGRNHGALFWCQRRVSC
jgi:hypothetical protein